jgi:hypothetical protein
MFFLISLVPWLVTLLSSTHKVLTYVEYRAVSSVFQNIDPPPPSPPSECVLPPHQRRGVHSRWAVRVNILEDDRHRIGLLQYNLSTAQPIEVISFRLYLLKLNGSKGAKHASARTQEHKNRKSAVIYDNLPMPSLPKSSVADP